MKSMLTEIPYQHYYYCKKEHENTDSIHAIHEFNIRIANFCTRFKKCPNV